MQHGAAPRRTCLALASLLLAPLAFRALTLVEEGLAPRPADLRGVVADFAVSLVLLGLLWPLARLARWLALLLVVLLVLLRYANYETVAALGAVVSLVDARYLGDRTFFFGSVAAASHPVLLGAVVLASVALAWPGLRGAGAPASLATLAAGGLLLTGLAAWPDDPQLASWRQLDVLEQNARWLVLPREPAGGSADPPAAMLALLPELGADLGGEPRFAWDGRGRNVLLVVLEGVSGAYLLSTAQPNRHQPVLILPRLDATSRENVSFTTLVNHQRKTNRGTYALLCGELPRLLSGTAKMTEAVKRPWRTCLPEILGGAGYHTVYLQAAPLAFMLKDRFLPAIGFDEVHGDEWFRRHYHRTRWGVDDRAFFEQALDMVERLRSEERPWFLTLLTVGTHHPYVVPFEPGRGARHGASLKAVRSPDEAFAYLDRAVGEFLEVLDRSGVRENTLVLLVSDESAGGFSRARGGVSGLLLENWGIAIALLPERLQERVREPYAQMDVALSILDYLGLGEAGSELFGRSLFRHYTEPRHLFFGNVNQRAVGALGPDETVVVCRYDGRECGTFEVSRDRLFAEVLREAPDDLALTELVRSMAVASAPTADARLDLALGLAPVLEVGSDEWQIIHGGQMVSLEPDEWIEVDFAVEVRGQGKVALEQVLYLAGPPAPLEVRTNLEGGQRLRLDYTFTAGVRLPQLEVRSQVRSLDGTPVELVLQRRHFSLHRSGPAPPRGVSVDVLELDPPAADGSRPELLIQPPSAYEPGQSGSGTENSSASPQRLR